MAAGAASVEVAADAESHKKAPAKVAGAPSVEVAADASCRKVKTQRQRRPPSTVGQLQQISRLRRRENCTGWCYDCCVRGRGRNACVDVAGIPHRRWQDRMRDKSIQCDYRDLHKVGARSRV